MEEENGGEDCQACMFILTVWKLTVDFHMTVILPLVVN